MRCQVMKSMPRIDESRKRKAEGGPSYGKKSKTDHSVLSAFTSSPLLSYILPAKFAVVNYITLH